jgi:thioredoxin 1
MATIDITEQSFAGTLEDNDIVVLTSGQHGAARAACSPLTYGAAAERHPDITFAKVDTETEQALAAAAGITSIPTPMAFKDNTLVSQPGALNPDSLEEVIQTVKNLYMDKLQADAAQRPA